MLSRTALLVIMMGSLAEVYAQTMFYPIILKPTPAVLNVQKDAHARVARRKPPTEAKINDIERTNVEVSSHSDDEQSSEDLEDMKGGTLKELL